MRGPSTGPTSPRIIWRATRRKNGCRCVPTNFYADNGIDLKLNAEAVPIDRARKEVRFADGAALWL